MLRRIALIGLSNFKPEPESVADAARRLARQGVDRRRAAIRAKAIAMREFLRLPPHEGLGQ